MSKKITKEEFSSIVTEAVGEEAKGIVQKNGGGIASMAVTLIGVSVGAKIMDKLFDNENEIEIITDKE